ncbi:MAG: four helix bundle protein [bacterium]|nr:four helix bundle protein [bacterium]
MNQIPNSKRYDLEERCLSFAKRVNLYVRKLPKDIPNIENGRQLTRSAGSAGANYIEANEALSKKDFVMRVKISKKETKESRYWLNLTEPSKENYTERQELVQETNELMKIFGSILEKSV